MTTPANKPPAKPVPLAAAAIAQDTVPEHAAGVAIHNKSGDLVLVREDGWYLATLNETAAVIWQLIDGQRSVEEIATEICNAAPVQFDVLLHDVLVTVESLSDKHALILLPRNIELLRAPHITCICLSHRRADHLAYAISCFQLQTYINKRLLIVYSSADIETAGLIANASVDPRISGLPLAPTRKRSLGELFNIGVAAATTEYISRWDDDDWSAPRRLELQMNELLRRERPACVLSSVTLHDTETDERFITNPRPWEGTIVCRKSDMLPYADASSGEDTGAIGTLVDRGNAVLFDRPDLYVYRQHAANVMGALFHSWLRKISTSTVGGSANDDQSRRRVRILYATLLPPEYGELAEDLILGSFLEEYSKNYESLCELRLLIGSAHQTVLDRVRKQLDTSCPEISAEYCLVPFKPVPAMDDLRAHEIGVGKSKLAEHYRASDSDVIFYRDSDIEISFAQVWRYAVQCLQRDDQFVSFPYVQKGYMGVGANALGCFCHASAVMKLVDYSGDIYSTVTDDGGRIKITGADDCLIHMAMSREGLREVLASGVTTGHYLSGCERLVYDGGTIYKETVNSQNDSSKVRARRARLVVSSEEEIEAHVKYRMGYFYQQSHIPSPEEIRSSVVDGFCVLNFKNGRCVDDLSSRHVREQQFARSVARVSPDRASFSLHFRFHDSAFGHSAIPCFGFFRPNVNNRVVLWPCHGCTTINAEMFGRNIATYDRPWAKKRDSAVWRGTTTGFVTPRSDRQVEALISAPIHIDDPISKQRLQQPSRLQLVARFLSDPDIDVGFSGTVQVGPTVEQHLIGLGLIKGSLSLEQLLSYKYLIVVAGNTAATQLPWALHSNSVVLMPPPCWDSIIYGLEPWEHYVPLAVDFRDLPEKLEWCRSHDAQCQAVSRAASALMARHYDEALEQSIQAQVVERYFEGVSWLS